MPDEETTQTTPPETPSISTSPQLSTEPAPEITPISEAPTMPPEALEAPKDSVITESNKEAPPKIDGIRVEMGNELKTPENQGGGNTASETVNSPLETAQSTPIPESVKPQTSTFEALAENVELKSESLNPAPPSQQTETKSPSVPPIIPPKTNLHELRKKELLALKNKTRKRIESVMNLFSKKAKIRNDDVEKYLHVSDATASRYLKTLEQEGKIQKEAKKGKLGKWVSYFKL